MEESYKKEVRKFYVVKNERKEFQPRNDFCRDKEGNIISEGIVIRKNGQNILVTCLKHLR
jgi:hypothetical protein